MLSVTLIGLGAISWYLLPIDFTIKLEFPVLRCMIPYPGAAPEQVEKEVAIPAEGEFLTIPYLKSITSRSDSGGCYILLRFDWNADMSAATAELRDRCERLKLSLPKEVEHIFLRRFGSQDWPILRFALFREENEADLARLIRTELKSKLSRVEGVAEVRVSGRANEEVYVDFERDALGSLNLPLNSVINTLQTSNLNLAVGRLEDGESLCYVRASNEMQDPRELEDVVVGTQGIRLKQVAKVNINEPAGAETFTVDGKHGVFIEVVKESEANIVETCDSVKEELQRVLDEAGFEGAEMRMFEDKSEYIRFAINSLMKAGAFGCLLSVLVLFLFLWRVRTTMLVAFATPMSIVSAFIWLYFRGSTLNIVTIASMITSLGMLVDNAIVVMENITRHNQMSPDRKENAIRGASEVAMAIAASTATTLVVFIPVYYLEAGELTIGMREFAGPVTLSLLTSLLVALTIIPLAECHLREREDHPFFRFVMRLAGRGKAAGSFLDHTKEVRLLARIRASYAGAIEASIHHRVHVIAILAIVGGLTALIPFMRVGVQQMPDMDMRQVSVDVRFERNYDKEMAKQVFDRLTSVVDSEREELGIKNLYVDYGSWGGIIRAYLKQADDLESGEEFPYTTEEVREIFAQQLPELLPGGTINCGVAKGGVSDSQSVTLTVRGDDAGEVADLADRFRDLVATLSNVQDAKTDRPIAEKELQLHVDEGLASQAGMNPLVVARTVDFALRGIQLPYMKKNGKEIPVRAQMGSEDRKTREDLDNLSVVGASGKLVPLTNVALLEKGYVPPALNRENGKSLANITVMTATKDMAQLTADLDRLLETFDMPRGYTIERGQQLSELETTMRNYRQALVLALILIYVVMATSFESCVLPFSILTTVPLAFIGVYWAMYLTGTSMDTVAYIGALLMCGVIVNNGIVIVDHINQLREEGMVRHEAVVQAGINRFRPVMMTALTTILGCVPMAIGTGKGNDAMNSLGRALVGGLTVGTLLTLFVVPVVYTLIDDAQGWVLRYIADLKKMGRRDRNVEPSYQAK